MMMRTIKELTASCNALQLTVTASRTRADGSSRYMKADYVAALRAYHMARLYPNGIPEHLRIALQIESPMLCFRFNDLKTEEQKEIWESPDWYFQEKWDGVRMLIIYVREEGIFFYSRAISVEDYLPIRYDSIYHQVDPARLRADFESFVIDTEVLSRSPSVSTVMGDRGVITETHLQAVAALLSLNPKDSLQIQQDGAPLYFRAFDTLMMNGHWATEMPFLRRDKGTVHMSGFLQRAGLDIQSTPSVNHDKRAFYNNIIDRGGEGVVAKHGSSPYITSTSRKRAYWVKIKRSMGETLAGLYGDTLDGWISGFKLGEEGKAHADRVGTLTIHISVRRQDGSTYQHEIANIAGLTDEERNAMTEQGPDGKPQLRQEYYGKVVEIDGQCISARSKRLRHAKIVRWRPDKTVDLCSIDEHILEKMVL